MRVIKRYSNRKLYDTEEKKYVTLDQISQLIKEGDEVKVVDNETGDDLTSVTLSQILVEQEKRREGGLPKSFLTELVKSSTTFFDYLRKTLSSWLSAAHLSEEHIERNIDDLVKKGQLTIEEGKKLRTEISERAREYVQRVDETVEGRVSEFLKRIHVPSKSDIDRLTERLDAVTRKYETLVDELRRRSIRIDAAPGPAAGAGTGTGTGAGTGAGTGTDTRETGGGDGPGLAAAERKSQAPNPGGSS